MSVGSEDEQRPDFHEATAFTAPDGRYVLPLTASEKSNVVAELRGYQRAASAWFDPKGTADVRVRDLALSPREPVPGIARFTDGAPVAGLTLTVWHGSLNAHPSAWSPSLGPMAARTDASGRFALALPPLPPDDAGALSRRAGRARGGDRHRARPGRQGARADPPAAPLARARPG